MQAAQLMLKDPDLQLDKMGRMPEQRDECGSQFKRKFTLLDAQHETLDMASRPGHRMIIVGGQSGGTLLGVASRGPFEQDVGLYCHNLGNMQIQLQHVLDGLKLVQGAPASTAAAGQPTSQQSNEAKPGS
jgi:hypothetical protein